MKKKNEPKIWIAVMVFMALMVTSVFAALAIGIVGISASGPTYVSGIISSNTTWTAEDSPYIVTGSILVEEGVTLTIEPGVVVKFNSAKAMQIDGELIAQGTEAEPIVFTSNQSSPASGDWCNIVFTDISVDATYDEDGNYLSGSIMQYCTVEYGGGSDTPAIKTISSSPFIDHCNVKNNGYSGIRVNHGSPKITNSNISNNLGYYPYIYGGGIYIDKGEVTISNNIISGNSAQRGGGIYTCGIGTVTLITNNTITDNSATHLGGGIHAIEGSMIKISGNIISNNSATDGGGIWYGGLEGTMTISYNEIVGNGATTGKGGGIHIGSAADLDLVWINYNNVHDNIPYDVYNANPCGSPDANATNNWWGTTNEAEIQAHIYDWYDDASLGIVDYIPYLTEPVTPENIPPIASFTYSLRILLSQKQ